MCCVLLWLFFVCIVVCVVCVVCPLLRVLCMWCARHSICISKCHGNTAATHTLNKTTFSIQKPQNNSKTKPRNTKTHHVHSTSMWHESGVSSLLTTRISCQLVGRAVGSRGLFPSLGVANRSRLGCQPPRVNFDAAKW